MLIFEDLSCAYNNKLIFANLSATIAPSNSVLLTGGNGSGKTSLLQIIAGLQSPHSGRVTWNDAEDVRDAVLSGDMTVNYIGHELAVKEELTVLENIFYWAELAGDVKYVRYAIDYFGLKKYAKTPCSQLSRGWQKKVALARLIVCGGDLWLLDEAFSNLDEETSEQLAALIRNKCENGGIAIVSSHRNISVDFNYKINISDFTVGAAPIENSLKFQGAEVF
jgi:heme exporter protein A